MSFKVIDQEYATKCFSYDAETGVLTWKYREWVPKHTNSRFAGKKTGYRHTCTVGKSYLQVRWDGKIYYAHRIAWVLMYGGIPEGMQIDHIDGDGTNNKAENLRIVSDSENKRNQRRMKNNTSGFTGVYRNKGKWEAACWQDGKKVSLGRYKSPEDAYQRRLKFNSENQYHTNHGTERAL